MININHLIVLIILHYSLNPPGRCSNHPVSRSGCHPLLRQEGSFSSGSDIYPLVALAISALAVTKPLIISRRCAQTALASGMRITHFSSRPR